MKKKNTMLNTASRSSFWLDRSAYSDWKLDNGSIDYTKLAATQRAIGNFVSIVTGKQIPVVFKSSDNSYTDGQRVVIGTDSSEKTFDPTVGLALHEASHIAYTDFTILKDFKQLVAMQGLDPDLSLTNAEFMCIKNLLNWIEDRRIDLISYNSAPGYRVYYESMYDKYFNAKIIDIALQEGAKTQETWDDYMFHIINFTNPNRNISALEKLQEVWNLIDLPNIGRLKTTHDAFVTACLVFKLINGHLASQPTVNSEDPEPNSMVPSSTGTGGDMDVDMPGDNTDADNSIDTETDEDDTADETDEDNAADETDTQIQSDVLTARQMDQLAKAIQQQQDFLDGETKKSGRKLSKTQAETVSAIKESGTEVVNIPKSYGDTGRVDGSCETVVIRRMTRNLIDHFPELFTKQEDSTKDMQISVMQGIQLGKQLGHKLQLRNENRTLKTSRLETGKIDRRLVSELGYGNVNVFHRIVADSYKNFMIHISIDASGSMSGEKMRNAVKSAVAIAQAASMTTGIRVQISFRGTAGRGDKPYTLYAYDSSSDKMTKIKTLFKHITTFGCTPEGAAFQSIEKYILADAKGDECIFINYSDGEPSSGYVYEPISYTKHVMSKFRRNGLHIISFFITSGPHSYYQSSVQRFKTMYGPDADFVDSTRLVEIAKSLNKRFLEQKVTS